MYSNTRYSEETITFAELERMRFQKREDTKYIVLQKLLGFFAFLIGIAEIVIANLLGIIDEGGIFLIMMPVGLYFLLTKKQIL